MVRIRYWFYFLGLTLAAAFCQAQSADDFFNDSTLHDIFIDLHPRDWAALKATFTENTYYPMVFRWRDQVHEGGGIRSRGAGSRSGSKPGLRVDFDRYETEHQFLGLKSVVLDNNTQDGSMARERLSMQLFRRLGLAAPREAHARLFVNSEYAGLYTIVESVDKRFLRNNLGEDSGYLYEYNHVEPYYFEFRGEDPAIYTPGFFQPQTRESEPAPGPLVSMIRTANEASDENFFAAMSEFLDLRRLAIHLAVENFVAELDGFVGYAGMNNFFLYRFNNRNLFQAIPWDKDLAMSEPEHPIDYNLETNVLTRRMMALPEIAGVYYTALQAAAETAGEASWLEQETERIYGQIQRAALEDANKVCQGGATVGTACNPVFEDEFNRLREFVRTRSSFVISKLREAGRYKAPVEDEPAIQEPALVLPQ